MKMKEIKEKLKNKKYLAAVLGIFGILIVTIGASYAFFSYSKNGLGKNTITTGGITFHYGESSRGISLSEAMPMTDAQGMAQTNYFDFEVNSKTQPGIIIPYTVTARVNSSATLDPSVIRIALTDQNDNEIESIKYFSQPASSTGKTWLEQYSKVSVNQHIEKVVYEGEVPANTNNYTKDFRARIWIADDTNFAPIEVTKYYCKGTEVEYESAAYNECLSEDLTNETTLDYPYNDKTFSITFNVYAEGSILTNEAGPGLYDSEGNLVASWSTLVNTYGLNIENDYYGKQPWGGEASGEVVDYISAEDGDHQYKNQSMIGLIISKNQELSAGTKLVIGNVDKIGKAAFYGAETLTEIVLPEGLTAIDESTFAECHNLERITIPSTVTAIERKAFYNDYNLNTLIFEENSQLQSIGERAFGYVGLKSISIPSGVTSIGEDAFDDINALYYTGTAEDTRNNNWGATYRNADSDDGFLYSDNTKTTITAYVGSDSNIVIPNTVTAIADEAFYDNYGITSVSFEENSQLQSIGERAFAYGDLKMISIPDSVTSIGNSAFESMNILVYTGSAGTGSDTWGARIRNPYVDGDFAYSDNTKTTLVGYLGSNSDVTIPSGVTAIGDSAFHYMNLIRSVTIPASVTSIGEDAFESCLNLKNVTFESGSQLTSIGNYAFAYGGLKTISIPSGVTTIGNYTFDEIDTLIYTGTAEDTRNNNWGAKMRNPYVDGDFVYSDSSKTTLVGYVGNSVNVTIPSGVTTIGNRVFYNIYLESVTIPSSVTTIGSRVFDDSSLKTLNVPSSVTTIASSSFSGVTIVYYTGSAVDTENNNWGARILNPYVDGDFVYSDNTKTTLLAYTGSSSNVTIPNTVTTIGEKVFYDMNNINSVTIPSSVTSIGDYAFSYSGLTSIEIPSSVTSIGNYAFNYSGLTSITIPSSVTSIGNNAFYGIKALNYTGSAEDTNNNNWGAKLRNAYVEGDFGYADNTKVTLIGYLGNASSVTIPSGVTTIANGAFKDNYNLISVTIPNTVTTIGNDAFSSCNRLEIANIPSSVTSIGEYAFSDTGIRSMTIPNSVTSIGIYAFNRISVIYYTGSAEDEYDNNWGAKAKNAYVEGDFAYSDTTKKTLSGYIGNSSSVTIPASVTTIGDFAFGDNYQLTSVTFENGSQLTTIGREAFRSTRFATIALPNTVTTIGDYAFQWNSYLSSITIPSSVTSIGRYAFGVSNLSTAQFVNTNGWYVNQWEDYPEGEEALSSSDLANQSTAASYLSNDYSNYYWTRH